MSVLANGWDIVKVLDGVGYMCGYCGHYTSPIAAFARREPDVAADYAPYRIEKTYICSRCGKPTYFESHARNQTPGPPVGDEVENLPKLVEELYDEARACMRVSAYTATALVCRKVLQNVSVTKGAKEGEAFKFYIQWLMDQGYTTPAQKPWVDRIKDGGNDATHKAPQFSRGEAEHLLTFTAMLLKQIFEFPARMGEPSSAAGQAKSK